MHGGLKQAGFSVFAPASPVVAVDMGDPGTAAAFWNALLDAGVYVNLAIPPGTPNSKSLLRCSVSAAHSPQQISQIVDAFRDVRAKFEQPAVATV